MTRNDYIFANVADIDIGGTVLPQHDANGAWRPERGEDWAFLAEAWGERSLIEYKDNYTPRTQAEVAAEIAAIRGERFMKGLRVADLTSAWSLFESLERMLRASEMKWCAGAPTEKSWNEDGESTWWTERCPEMFPARQLEVGAHPERKDWLWEAEKLRAAFADLAANEKYICSYWFEAATQKSRFENSYGMSEEISGFEAEYAKNETMGDVAWWHTTPRAPTLTLPDGAGTPVLATLWHATGQNAGVDKWYVKNVAPDGITGAFMEEMLPQMTGSGDAVAVELAGFRMIVPINLRTKLT